MNFSDIIIVSRNKNLLIIAEIVTLIKFQHNRYTTKTLKVSIEKWIPYNDRATGLPPVIVHL